jgi:O-antigen/teichoic acid export membrane protein
LGDPDVSVDHFWLDRSCKQDCVFRPFHRDRSGLASARIARAGKLTRAMLLRQTLLYLPAQIVVPLSQLLAAVLWTYWLGPEAMGTYAIIWSLQEIIYLGALSWWSTYCLRYANGLLQDGKGVELDRTETAIQLYSALVQTAAALAAMLIFVPEELGLGAFLTILAFTLTRNLSTHFATRARAQLEVAPYSINLGLASVLGLAFGWAAVSWWEATPLSLLLAYAAAHAAGLVASLPFMRVLPRKPVLDPAILRQAVAFGGPLMVSSALSWAGNHSIRFIVEFGSGRAEVGLMTVGWWLGLRIATFVGLLIMGAAFNVAVERHRTGGAAAALQQLAVNTSLLLGILVPAVAGTWLVGDQLVALMVAETYREMTASILPIAVCAGAARVFRELAVDPVFLIFEKPRLPALNALIDAAGTVVLCSVGLSLGGVVGAAWGCLLAAAGGAAASAAMARGRLGYFVDWRDLGRISLATAGMSVPLFWLPAALSPLGLAAAVMAAVAIYAAILAAFYPAATARYAGRGMAFVRAITGAK